MRKTLLTLLCLSIYYASIYGQTNQSKWSIGGGLTVLDFGNNIEEKEYNQFNQFKYVDNSASIFVTRNLSRVFDLRGHFGTGSVDFGGQIQNNSKYPNGRPYYNTDLSLILKLAKKNPTSTQIVIPYFYGGIGFTKMVFFEGNGCITEPYGFGFLITASPKLSIILQTAFTISTDEAPILKDLYRPNLNPAYENFTQTTIGVTYNLGKIKSKNSSEPTIEVPAMADRDMDGIENSKDSCPDIKGTIALNGCPDTDADGIEDSKDKCPTVAGMAIFGGCPDTDNDGIEDSKDRCPLIAGLAQYEGCPDTDGDGIADNKDECPYSAGIVALNGCPDSDGDGVADINDNCPQVSGTISNKGCPEIKVEEKAKLIADVKSIQFETGKDVIKLISYASLNDAAAIIQKYDGYEISIYGHTDNTGSEVRNQELSERRALAVSFYLQSKGVPASRITEVKGFGATQPIADNATPAGRTMNRRTIVELIPRQ